MTPAATDGATSQVATTAAVSEAGVGLGSTDVTTGLAAQQGGLGDMAGLKEVLVQSATAGTPGAESRDEKVRVLVSRVTLAFTISNVLPFCTVEYYYTLFRISIGVPEIDHVCDVIDG